MHPLKPEENVLLQTQSSQDSLHFQKQTKWNETVKNAYDIYLNLK